MAIELGIPHGGWVPKGRKTERGPLPPGFLLQEILTASYSRRTEQNVKDTGPTLCTAVVMPDHHYMIYDGGNYTHGGKKCFESINELIPGKGQVSI